MRVVILMSFCAVATAAAASISATAAVQRPPAAADRSAVEVVRMAADSLVARRRAMPGGGLAWRSSVQAPHYHTDRDVGAASIGAGLLAAYAVTRDRDYLRAARGAGDYLLGVAEPAAGGLRWPDWADPDGRRSDTHYTSFDDGAAGISDYLWTLYEVTHESRFRAGALGGVRWLVAQGKGRSCPETACSWRWTDDPARHVAHYGVGMGQAGIVLVLDAFADRTSDSTFRAYARAGAARLRTLTANGARPLPRSDESATHETGFLSGSAGAAYMFLERYRRHRDPVDLATARRLLAWVDDQAVVDSAGEVSWPFAGHAGAWTASGFELGVAGIAWVNLQASRTTGDAAYSARARRAGRWLRRVAVRGGTWEELPGDHGSPLHVGLDSGAAGIGWVLEDLARAGIDTTSNRAAARTALAGLRTEARHDRLGAFWYESRTGAGRRLRAEPSWHWGAAGVAAFAARLAGWSGLTPGGQRGG